MCSSTTAAGVGFRLYLFPDQADAPTLVLSIAMTMRLTNTILFMSSSLLPHSPGTGFPEPTRRDRPVTEDDFCDPASHSFTYAVMKLLNEHMGRRYVKRCDADIICARPPVVYGHGRHYRQILAANPGLVPEKMPVGRQITLPAIDE